jgi:hypothetical protein
MRTNVPCVRFIALLLALTILSSRSSSQSITTNNGKWEIGLGFGPMFFLGDLGGSAGIGRPFIKDLDLPLTQISKNLYANYYATEWLGFRLALNHGVLKGDDSQAPNKGGDEVDRLERNLSFKTNVFEGYIAAEIYPTVFMEKYDGLAGKFRPYVIGGIGVMKFNPKAQLDGQWVALRPLRLEGQGMSQYPDSKPYSLVQKEIPLGFGFKYYMKENFYVGIEILHRKMFTDYVDDVSHNYYIDPVYFNSYLTPTDAAKAKRLYYRGIYTNAQSRPGPGFERGDPKQNDAYFSTILRFGWRLGGEHARELRQLRCPVFY